MTTPTDWLTPKQLEEIAELEKKATPGPWEISGAPVVYTLNVDDMSLAVALRNALPALLSMARAAIVGRQVASDNGDLITAREQLAALRDRHARLVEAASEWISAREQSVVEDSHAAAMRASAAERAFRATLATKKEQT